MNDPTLYGPCAGHEIEIVDFHEGTLGPDLARQVRAHLDACPRCREWLARYASLDAALARELPRPELPASFGAMLRERLAGTADPANRRALRATAEVEHDWLVTVLKRRARRQAIAGVAAGAGAAAAAISLAVLIGPEAAGLVRQFGLGHGNAAALGVLGAAAAIGALAWSARRGVLPGVPLRG